MIKTGTMGQLGQCIQDQIAVCMTKLGNRDGLDLNRLFSCNQQQLTVVY